MDLSYHSLFKLEHNSFSTKGFAWASGYRPVPGRKSFIHPAEIERMEEFFRLNPEPPGIHIDGGYRWPDFLGQGGGGLVRFFVSERVLSSLQRHGIEYLDATEYPIALIADRRLKAANAPRYFVLEAVPELEVDWVRMGYPVDALGNPRFDEVPRGWQPGFRSFKHDSWSGRDLVGELRDPTAVYGSARLALIGGKERWTNFTVEGAGRFPQFLGSRPDAP